jgi:hypothetical protein
VLKEAAKYRDVIVNALDLLSFLLVTPEILKVAKTTYSYLLAWIVLLLLFSSVPVAVFFLFKDDAGAVSYQSPLNGIALWLILASPFLSIYLWRSKFGSKILDTLGVTLRLLTGHFFFTGVIIFLLTRIFALVTAYSESRGGS